MAANPCTTCGGKAISAHSHEDEETGARVVCFACERGHTWDQALAASVIREHASLPSNPFPQAKAGEPGCSMCGTLLGEQDEGLFCPAPLCGWTATHRAAPQVTVPAGAGGHTDGTNVAVFEGGDRFTAEQALLQALACVQENRLAGGALGAVIVLLPEDQGAMGPGVLHSDMDLPDLNLAKDVLCDAVLQERLEWAQPDADEEDD